MWVQQLVRRTVHHNRVWVWQSSRNTVIKYIYYKNPNSVQGQEKVGSSTSCSTQLRFNIKHDTILPSVFSYFGLVGWLGSDTRLQSPDWGDREPSCTISAATQAPVLPPASWVTRITYTKRENTEHHHIKAWNSTTHQSYSKHDYINIQ